MAPTRTRERGVEMEEEKEAGEEPPGVEIKGSFEMGDATAMTESAAAPRDVRLPRPEERRIFHTAMPIHCHSSRGGARVDFGAQTTISDDFKRRRR